MMNNIPGNKLPTYILDVFKRPEYYFKQYAIDYKYPFDDITIKNIRIYCDEIASLYDVIIKYNNKIKSYGNYGKNVITMNDLQIKYPNKSDEFYIKNYVIIFCHELAHHIQSYIIKMKFQKHSYKKKFGVNSYFENILLYENNAEKISYMLYKKYFKNIVQMHANHFYDRSKWKIDFLKNYYGV